MNKNIITMFLLIFITSTVWADGVEVSLIEGNTVVPVQNNNIQMVSEEVRILPATEERSIPHPLIPFIKEKIQISKGTKVEAVFLFANLEAANVSIKMGFPISKSSSSSAYYLKDFKVWVENRPVKVNKYHVKRSERNLLKDSAGEPLYSELLVWEMAFTNKEKKSVKVEYIVQWGTNIRGNPASYFEYITRTGALWSGNIERADFYVQMDREILKASAAKDAKYKLNIKPASYVIKGDYIEWHFTNWKPAEDISIAINEVTPSEKDTIQNLSYHFKDKLYEGNKRYYTIKDIEIWNEIGPMDYPVMRRLFTKALRNDIYARHGRIFTTPEMKKIFESSSWYKSRSDFKESDLNEIEKKNVEFIFEYEKKMGWK